MTTGSSLAVKKLWCLLLQNILPTSCLLSIIFVSVSCAGATNTATTTTMASHSSTLMPSVEVVERILQSEAPFRDNIQKEACQNLVHELTEEEQEMAACTSYAYWAATTTGGNTTTDMMSSSTAFDRSAARNNMAMREARRHYVGQGEKYEDALEKLREACHDRKERHTDLLRTCFRDDITYNTQEEAELAERYCSDIREDLQNQIMVVRGMDRDSRAIVVKFPRQATGSNVDAYITTQIYIAERAIAVSEFLSEGRDEKVMAIFDFAQYSSKNSPPLSSMKSVATILQHNYPERLRHLFIIHAPYWMRMIFKLLQPFLSADTREKVRMIAEDTRQEVLAEWVEDEYAAKLAEPVDLDRFLKHTPFHEPYCDSEGPVASAHESVSSDKSEL